MSSEKMIVMRTSDGEIFEVEEAVALQFQIIKHMIEDDCADGVIPLPNVTSKIMSKVIQYCECHVNKADTREADEDHMKKMKMFDKEFADDLDIETLYHLLMAANYLEIKDLLDLLCARVADMIKGKTPEQIRETFNIKNDFTKEEEDELHRKNSWAFD